MRFTVGVAIALVVVSFLIGAYLYPRMTDTLSSHWNSKGEADGETSKFTALFAIPIVSLILLLIFLAIPKIDPRRENIHKFRKHYDWLIFVIVAFMFYIYLLSIFWNLGARFNFVIALVPAFAVLFLFVGFLMEKAKRNWFVGIRTPWTLSSEKVWDKTHKLGARMFKTVGIVVLFGIVFQGLAVWFMVVPVVAVALYLVVYSYLEYRKIRR